MDSTADLSWLNTTEGAADIKKLGRRLSNAMKKQPPPTTFLDHARRDNPIAPTRTNRLGRTSQIGRVDGERLEINNAASLISLPISDLSWT